MVCGGHASRWSYGFPWIVRYVDKRYTDILGHQGLTRFVDQFPDFFDAIQQKVQQTTTHHFNDGNAQDVTGLNFLPFDIFGFVDCTIYRMRRPYSGPAGDFIGAPRKERYYHTIRKEQYTPDT